jgi:hypothetical protein
MKIQNRICCFRGEIRGWLSEIMAGMLYYATEDALVSSTLSIPVIYTYFASVRNGSVFDNRDREL